VTSAARRDAAAAVVAIASVACLSASQRQPAVPAFDAARAFEDLRTIVAIGPRPAGSEGARKTRDYIREQLTAAGLTVEEQPFDARTPLGVVKMVNVRVRVPGADSSRGRLIIAGHYDTKLFKDFVFVGANDGGSSTAFLIELGRALRHRRNALPIELLFLDGEEAVVEWQGLDHTYGSRHYVTAARANGTLKDIRAMILVDMIGDRDLRIPRDPRSTRWLTDTIWAAAKRLNRREFVDAEFPIEDDHIEFLQAGVPAVDLIDFTYPDENLRYWHTAEDTIDKCSPTSLQAVADVLLAALPDIEKRLGARR
jgi:glutaminyl-peptide cyclotransferase